MPSLPASAITSGTFALAMIPDLPASSINSGTLALTTVPSLPASAITSGTLNLGQLPNLAGTYVATAGSTMTGALTLPANGFAAGTSQLVLSGGNVGIGTTTSNTPLYIFETVATGSAPVDLLTLDVAPSTGTGPTGFGPSILFRDAGGGTTSLMGRIAAVYEGTNSGADLSFYTAVANTLSEEMRLTSSGYLGIGTTTPGTPLEVDTQAASTFLSVAKFLAPANSTAGNVSQIDIGQSSGTGNSAQLRFAYQGNNSLSNRFDVGWTGYPSPTLSALVNGNVGIGSTAPAGTLDVNGTICFAGANCRSTWPAGGSGSVTSVATGTGLAGGTFTTSGTLSMATVGSAGTYAKVVTDALGRVISATTLSSSDLPPIAAGAITSGSFSAGEIPPLPASIITSGTFNVTQLPNHSAALITSGTLGVANGGTGLTATPTNGQIPIGNNSGYTLATLTAGSGITVTNGAGSITIASTGGGGSSYVALAGSTMTGALTLPANGLVAGTNQLVLSGGNVGIGSSSPSGLLDVEGGTSASSVNGIGLKLVAQAGSSSNGGSVIIDAGTASSGNGGSVTIAAGAASSGNGGAVSLTSGSASSGNGGNLSLSAGGGANGYNNGNLILNPGAGSGAIGGNVGIGSSSPSAFLDVEGGTAANGYNGGGIKLIAQSGNSSNGGAVTITAGLGSSGSGGAVTISSGAGSSASAGNITLTAGNGASGFNSGNIFLVPGTSAGGANPGNVGIGTNGARITADASRARLTRSQSLQPLSARLLMAEVSPLR